MDSNAQAARHDDVQPRVWAFADCEFDELRRELRIKGRTIELEPKPLEVLFQLLLHSGQVVTKEQLLDWVWPGTMVVDGSLATAVSKLRKALGDEDSSILLTVPRVGYRLGVPVRVGPAGGDSSSKQRASQAPDGERVRGRVAERPFGLWITAVALIVILIALGIYERKIIWPPKRTVAANAIASIGVLPLVNLSGDPSQEYLADGMTEELITELSKIRALKVISRTTMMQYKGAQRSLPKLAHELNVDAIVEGAVFRSGNRVRITAQLIYAPADTNLWADSFERDLGDTLNLQKELARKIADEIKINVSPSEAKSLASSPAVNPEAHDLDLRGRYFWNRRTRDGLNRALDYFRQASEKDPNDPFAYAGLADSYVELVGFGNMYPAEGIPKAKAAAQKAIELDESLAEPHTALGYAYAEDFDWIAAQKEFQRALDLDPGFVIGLYQYALYLSVIGKHDDAISLAQKAVDLDPLSPIVLYRAGRVQFQARHFPEAEKLFRRILELDVSDPLGLYGQGLVYDAEGKFNSAIFFLEKQNLQQGFDVAAVYAESGNQIEARRRLDEATKKVTDAKAYLRPGWVAEVYVALDDKTAAMEWLERGYKEHDLWLALLKVWPRFDPLRADPRYQDLLKRVNFPD